jgi:hypothetical protein
MKSKRYKSEDEAKEAAMNFRIINETQRRNNRDRERVWIGNSNDKYSDVATNCSALAVTDQTSFNKVHIENPNLTLTRNEWRVLSADEEAKIAKLQRYVRRSAQSRRKRVGISINYHQLKIRGKRLDGKIDYYRNERVSKLTDDINLFSGKRELLNHLLQSTETHRLIIPNDVDIPEDTEDVNSILDVFKSQNWEMMNVSHLLVKGRQLRAIQSTN